MGLISTPKWPSVNPFSHPLGSKIGRKPMVNPSKWVNLKSNFLKFHHRNQVILGIEKARKIAYFRAFLALLSCRLSLAELRSATSGFETVLREFLSCFPLILRAFPAFCLSVIRCADHKKRPFFIQRQADETHHLLPQTTPLVYCTSLLHKCP